VTENAFFGMPLPDLDEPWQWRQARLDALESLERASRDELKRIVLDGPIDDMSANMGHLWRRVNGQARLVVQPAWLPPRPGRRMPSAVKVARYWATQRPDVFDVCAEEPACFRCGLDVEEWGWLGRAHLVDRWLGGLDHAANLAMLCSLCHRIMPSYDIDEAAKAIAWIKEGERQRKSNPLALFLAATPHLMMRKADSNGHGRHQKRNHAHDQVQIAGS
jgi:hypothetical protein